MPFFPRRRALTPAAANPCHTPHCHLRLKFKSTALMRTRGSFSVVPERPMDVVLMNIEGKKPSRDEHHRR